MAWPSLAIIAWDCGALHFQRGCCPLTRLKSPAVGMLKAVGSTLPQEQCPRTDVMKVLVLMGFMLMQLAQWCIIELQERRLTKRAHAVKQFFASACAPPADHPFYSLGAPPRTLFPKRILLLAGLCVENPCVRMVALRWPAAAVSQPAGVREYTGIDN
jgi:hypothetical protein